MENRSRVLLIRLLEAAEVDSEALRSTSRAFFSASKGLLKPLRAAQKASFSSAARSNLLDVVLATLRADSFQLPRGHKRHVTHTKALSSSEVWDERPHKIIEKR